MKPLEEWLLGDSQVAYRVDKGEKQLQRCLEECSCLQKSLEVDAVWLLQVSAGLGWQECCFLPWHSLTEEFPLSICRKLYPSKLPTAVPKQIEEFLMHHAAVSFVYFY